MWILIIIIILLFGFGYYLNRKYNKEDKKLKEQLDLESIEELNELRRKYDEEDGPNTEGIGRGCKEAVDSSKPGTRTEEPSGSDEERRILSNSKDSSNATDIPSPITNQPEPTTTTDGE